MKKINLLLVVLLCAFGAHAEGNRLDSIKTKVMYFLLEKEDYYVAFPKNVSYPFLGQSEIRL